MKKIEKITLYIFSFLAFLMGETLYGQNDIHFSYECEAGVSKPAKARILLKSPDNKIFTLFADTVNEYEFYEKNYFKSNGKYILSVWFEDAKHVKDSLNYDFELSGKEIITLISISLDYRERLIKKGEIYVKGEKVLNGYIRVNKHYDAPKTVVIQIDSNEIGNEFRGPFFTIKNNSKDTLYGEHLPGYFWGTLSYIRNDSILSTRIGNLDYNFVDSPPLYPNSTKIATVGSFGFTNKLKPFEYRFEVLLAKKWQPKGVGVYIERQNFIWWAGTKEYYKLKYDFIVND